MRAEPSVIVAPVAAVAPVVTVALVATAAVAGEFDRIAAMSSSFAVPAMAAPFLPAATVARVVAVALAERVAAAATIAWDQMSVPGPWLAWVAPLVPVVAVA